MSDLTGLFGVVAGFFSFSAYIFYIRAILKGTTKPSRSTWFIWAFIGIVLAFSYRASGAEDTVWVAVSEAIAPTIIALLSIKYGVGGTEKTDIISFAGSALSLLLWWVFDSPLVALSMNLVVDSFAAIPTIKKSWRKPNEEDRLAWTLTQTGNLLNLFAIDKFTIGVVMYPLYIFIIDGLITGLLYKPKILKQNT